MPEGRNIVALDMEWNQPLPWKEYPHVPRALMPGEVIQIGAVKLRPDGQQISELRLSVRPRYFKQVHWKVKKLTQISEEEMLNGMPFPEAAKALGDWLTEDGLPFDIFAWGGEDERVLTANLDAWGLNPAWLPDTIYDLRFIYDCFQGRYEQSTSLTDAAAELGADLDLIQHDSLNDARYLAAICTRTDLERGMAEYEELGSAPAPGKPMQRLRVPGLADCDAAVKHTGMRAFTCPACERALNVKEWIPQNKDRQIALVKCNCGAAAFLRMRLNLRPGGTLTALRTVYVSDDTAAEYYKKRYTRYQNAQRHAKRAKEARGGKQA